MNEEENNVKKDSNIVSDVAKNKFKQIAKKWLIKIIAIVIIGIFIAGAVLVVFNAVGDVVERIKNAVVNFFTVDSTGAIEVSNEQIDNIINGIQDLKIELEDIDLMGDVVDETDIDALIKNKEALRKYIRKFYEAEAVTQTLDYNLEKDPNKTYGRIEVYRARNEEVGKDGGNKLTYISYQQMLQMIMAGNPHVENYFTISESDQLVVPEIIKTTRDGVVSYNFRLKSVDYKSLVSQYATSMNYFLYLTMTTKNPEFVAAFAELVKKDTEIHLTLMDAVYVDVIETEHSYTVNEKSVDENGVEESSSTHVSKKSKTIIETMVPHPAVTYAKTWFSEQTIEYYPVTVVKPPVYEEVRKPDETEPKNLEPREHEVWITDDITTKVTNSTVTSYHEGTRGNVIDRTGNIGDGEKSFIGLLDVKFKIPNTKRKEAAGGNFVSSAEIFCYLLKKDPSSQNLEQITRYILYKYTGKYYGATGFGDVSGYYEAPGMTSSSTVGGTVGSGGTIGDTEGATEMQIKIAEIAASKDTFGCGKGYCQKWVAEVYKKAGQTRSSQCCAGMAGNKWIESESTTNIPLGACVYAGNTGASCSYQDTNHPGIDASHVGIYIGDGKVASNVGGIKIESLQSWISTYGWRGWGWNGGTDYSK